MKLFTATLVATCALFAGSPARAQAPDVQADPETPTTGWSVTPSLGYGGTWDDNVLMKGRGDSPLSDYQNAINPSAAVTYRGRRNQLSGDYSGTFFLYHDLYTLNSYAQRASGMASHRLTQHVTTFARGSWAK